MAGVTIIEQIHKSMKKITFNWTMTGGQADGTTLNSYDGQVLRVNCMPCSCTGYDLDLFDSDSVDLLGGQGATINSGGDDFGTSIGSVSMPLSVVSGTLNLDVTGTTGLTDTGQTIVYIR